MGHDQFAGNVLEIMLSWFRALMSGVWSLFTGSSGGSLLSWLSGSWKSLLVILLTIGVVTDVVVYLLRWRPFWWWFRKKRMVVDDAILEPNEPLPSARRPAPARRVQPSTRIPRRESDVRREQEEESRDDLFMEPSLFDVKPARQSSAKPAPTKNSDLFMDDSPFDAKPARQSNVKPVHPKNDDLFMDDSPFDAKPARQSGAKPANPKNDDLFMDDSLFDVKPAKPKARGASSSLYAPTARGGRSAKPSPRLFDDDD